MIKENESNICIVYQDQYPWDVRIEKFCLSLSNSGFVVHLLCRNRDNLPVIEHVNINFSIYRIKYFRNKFVNDLFNTPAFFSPSWIISILRIIKKYNKILLVVRDLPLSPAGVLIGKIFRIPVYLDMAENYPAMIKDTWKFGKLNKYDFLIRNPFLLKVLERMIVPFLDGIFVVSAQSKQRLSSFGIDSQKIHIVNNTPNIRDDELIDESIYGQTRSTSDLIVTYVGGLEESRGVDTVIKSFPEVLKYNPKAVFIIVGKGTSYNYLNDLSKSLGIQKNIIFLGYKPREEIPSIIKASDICIIPHYVTEHIDTTLPNKLFDYMLQQKPIIATNSKSLMHIIGDNNCGLIYESGNHVDLSEKIKALFDPNMRSELGKNGRIAVTQGYNWRNDEKELLNVLTNAFNRK